MKVKEQKEEEERLQGRRLADTLGMSKDKVTVYMTDSAIKRSNKK